MNHCIKCKGYSSSGEAGRCSAPEENIFLYGIHGVVIMED